MDSKDIQKFYNENVTTPFGRECDLYEFSTYRRTEKLEALVRGDEPLTKEVLLRLYDEFLQGSMDVGVPPTLIDFGEWLSGTGDFSMCQPADVVW